MEQILQYNKVEDPMSDKPINSDNEDDYESCDSEATIDIAQQIQQSIKQLGSLELKVQVIAINNYLLQKRQNDKKKQVQLAKLEFKIRNSYNIELDQIYGLIADGDVVAQDFQFMISNKHLFKQDELSIIQKVQNGQQKVSSLIKPQLSQYWLKCMTNSDIIAQQIHSNDRQVLKNLYKIQAAKNQDGTKLTVSFYFKPNQWFSNEKLSKIFTVNKQGQAVKSEGTEIEWKQNQNYTVRVQKIKKKKKGKKIQKQQVIRQPSFFHYFESISSNQEQNSNKLDEDAWEELMEDLELQYELSVHIYQDLIPKSLEFYLGVTYNQGTNVQQQGLASTNNNQMKKVDELQQQQGQQNDD